VIALAFFVGLLGGLAVGAGATIVAVTRSQDKQQGIGKPDERTENEMDLL
jgi:hypothetical protein